MHYLFTVNLLRILLHRKDKENMILTPWQWSEEVIGLD